MKSFPTDLFSRSVHIEKMELKGLYTTLQDISIYDTLQGWPVTLRGNLSKYPALRDLRIEDGCTAYLGRLLIPHNLGVVIDTVHQHIWKCPVICALGKCWKNGIS